MLVGYIDSVAQPCPKDFKSYLEISYDCVDGTYNMNSGNENNNTVLNSVMPRNNSCCE